LLGSDCLIGISAESAEDAIQAEQQGADYIGISPIFSTPTTTDTAPASGLEGVRQIRQQVRIPLAQSADGCHGASFSKIPARLLRFNTLTVGAGCMA
jgi:hypothetical protein